MTLTTITPEALLRHAIGFDPLYRYAANPQVSFPPHNIEKLGDDHYRLTLAVAGYARDDISIQVHRDTLTIKGEKTLETKPNYVYQGIALRNFERQFNLGPHVEVTQASLIDGLLVVDLERMLPEADKPRLIHID